MNFISTALAESNVGDNPLVNTPATVPVASGGGSLVGLVVIGVLVAAAVYFVYNSKTEDGWDFKQGAAAFVALGAAVAAWFSDFGDTVSGWFN